MMYEKHARKKPLALIADDDLSLRLSIKAALKKCDFDVLEAENGRQALALFHAEKPDFILLDVIMPEMDGFDVCAAIRKSLYGRYPQILMVTGLDDVESTARAFEVGANDFVSKPINWVMLGHRARYMLRAGFAFRELYMSQSRLAKTQELAKLGNWQIDLNSNDFHCSTEASRLLRLDTGNAPVSLDDFLAPIMGHEKEKVRKEMNDAVKARKNMSVSYSVLYPDGTQKHILNQGEILFNEQGMPEMMLGVVQDVSQLKRAEEEIMHLAFYDGLTGLANRMLFLDRLDMAIKDSTRNDQKFALLFLDLDRFKRINDTLGHHIGDLLLKQVAEKMQACIRSTDLATRNVMDRSEPTISRLAGDEFTIILSNIRSPESAALVARRLIKEISTEYDLEGQEVSVSASIGISVFPNDGQTADILLRNADSAMYNAKNSGKNQFQFYIESLNIVATERFSLERDLARAIDRNELVLYYQPQIDLATRKIVGAEALIRWMHPQKGMVPPDKFIHVAEESGLIIDINKWVLLMACRQSDGWIKNGFPDLNIAVNLSGYKFAHQNIVTSIRDVLETTRLDPTNIEIEITETILMQETEETIETLKEIKDLGVRIALDDFGTGYSSLSYLTTFPVDVIKIDRSFVIGSTIHKNNRIIIKAIIAMGHSLGKKILAEGIETEEQYELLKSYGCDEAQGYYFKAPVPATEFFRLLKMGSL